MRLVKLTCRASLVALLAACGASAEARPQAGGVSRAEELSRPVRAGSKTTYYDLLRELFPDLRPDGSAHETVPVRGLSEPGKSVAIRGDIEFSFKPYPFNSSGRRLLALWVELKAEGVNEGTPYEGEAALLAIFTLDPSPRLLDAADVKSDRFTAFSEDRPLFRLDARNDAFVVHNTHWNAGESYDSIDMLFVDAGRIKTVARLFLYSTQGCGATFSEKPQFRAAADPSNAYPKVFVRVELKKGPDDENCERRSPGYVRYYEGVYRWNAARRGYETGSRALGALEKFNGRRVSSP